MVYGVTYILHIVIINSTKVSSLKITSWGRRGEEGYSIV